MKAILLKYLVLSAGVLAASGAAPQAPPAFGGEGSIGVAVVRMLGGLALVIGLFFACAWGLRHWPRTQGKGVQRKLHVLEGKSLGARQALYVVAYEQQRLLIGATPQGLTLLTHLPEGQAPEENARVLPVSFGEALLQALGRK